VSKSWKILPRPGSRISERGHFQFVSGDLRFQEPEVVAKELPEVADYLNELEDTLASQATELSNVKEQLRSLREDLSQFSTFEQICNSGMLRNFKIDSESEFAKVILKLLQQTMELQINHLTERSDRGLRSVS
jgi:Asp-tRNA(Asn)/Glu-tRNA(Gln) amidotransferase C subunit